MIAIAGTFSFNNHYKCKKKWYLSNIFYKEKQYKNEALSNMKLHQVLSLFGHSQVGVSLRDSLFTTNIVIQNLHPTKGTHGVAYIDDMYFDSYRGPPLGKFFFLNDGKVSFCILNTKSSCSEASRGPNGHSEGILDPSCSGTVTPKNILDVQPIVWL